uniref:hypothetical protein n=1 Tax=Arenibacter lacus TaxID=2608629 RepID=UPI001CC59BC9
MMNNVIIFIIFFACIGANAQVVTLNGTVSDSLNIPLAYSTLIAKPADSDRSMVFTTTNNQGEFKLKLHKGLHYPALFTKSFFFKEFEDKFCI